MASLKEVKGRIATVNNTRKITSAMKMVASAKLHKAQGAITNMLPYERSLHRLFTNFLSGGDVQSCYTVAREVKRIALVVFSSNSSLCGGFNANVIKHTTQWLDEHQSLGKEQILIYPVGKKVADALVKQGYAVQGDFQHMADKPSFAEASALAQQLMDMFEKGKVDRVELLYNHFKSTASQILTHEVYLPLQTCPPEDPSLSCSPDDRREEGARERKEETDYILEPSREELLATLLPKVLRMKLYTVLLDSNASEHAARTMAMQIATDNADDLLQELTLMYNKTRQQAITNELLDIVGGSMA
ncbi:MAG: F0F1 ATP synthase subunit gamma [Bacteroidaceae bacterium]|nr:F0F1 ATP synthase subunit gamma [Bacteroidaceae bacterium]